MDDWVKEGIQVILKPAPNGFKFGLDRSWFDKIYVINEVFPMDPGDCEVVLRRVDTGEVCYAKRDMLHPPGGPW